MKPSVVHIKTSTYRDGIIILRQASRRKRKSRSQKDGFKVNFAPSEVNGFGQAASPSYPLCTGCPAVCSVTDWESYGGRSQLRKIKSKESSCGTAACFLSVLRASAASETPEMKGLSEAGGCGFVGRELA